MRSVIQIKVKILNPNRAICLGAFIFFQIESHDHGRDLITSCVVLRMIKTLEMPLN